MFALVLISESAQNLPQLYDFAFKSLAFSWLHFGASVLVQKYGQVLEEDSPFHVVLEALIALEDDAALIANATPEVISYLNRKSRIHTHEMMTPTESGYADLLAVVLRVRGDNLEAGKVFRSLAHRAEHVDFSLRIRYLEEAIEEVSHSASVQQLHQLWQAVLHQPSTTNSTSFVTPCHSHLIFGLSLVCKLSLLMILLSCSHTQFVLFQCCPVHITKNPNPAVVFLSLHKCFTQPQACYLFMDKAVGLPVGLGFLSLFLPISVIFDHFTSVCVCSCDKVFNWDNAWCLHVVWHASLHLWALWWATAWDDIQQQ